MRPPGREAQSGNSGHLPVVGAVPAGKWGRTVTEEDCCGQALWGGHEGLEGPMCSQQLLGPQG